MQFGDAESGWGWMIAGVIVLLTALMMRRRTGPKVREPLSDLQSEIRRRESSMIGQLQRMEVRLHDATREVEGRLQTRVAQLDQLILEADREIVRLQKLLKSGSVDSDLPTNSTADVVTDLANQLGQNPPGIESSMIDGDSSPAESAVDLIVRISDRKAEHDSLPQSDRRRSNSDEAAA